MLMAAAVWFQSSDALAELSKTNYLIMIFLGMIAFAAVAMAIIIIVLASKLIRIATEASVTIETVKGKLLPLIHTATEIATSTQAIVQEATPKVKAVTDNLVKTSAIVLTTAESLKKTVDDANTKTQRQVARVDGMVSAALTTTAEVVESINHGIRVPAQKIASMAGQAKDSIEALMDKVKGMSFGPKSTPGSAPKVGPPLRRVVPPTWPPKY